MQVPGHRVELHGQLPETSGVDLGDHLRCGFRVLDDAELTPGLREVRRREAGHGLDRWPRVCMRRGL